MHSPDESPPPELNNPPASRRPSYRATLVISVSLLVVLTGLSITWFSYRRARTNSEQLAGALFREVTHNAAAQTRDYLGRATPVVRTLAGLVGGETEEMHTGEDGQERLARQLLAVLSANPGLGWVSLGDESGRFTGAFRTEDERMRINRSHIANGRTRMIEHNVLPDGSWALHRSSDDHRYDPRLRPWYMEARDAGKLVWLGPYIFFDQAGVPGVTCAAPVYDDGGRIKAVVTADFDLRHLSSLSRRLQFSPNSRVLVLADDGTVLGHPVAPLEVPAHRREEGDLLKIGDISDPVGHAFFDQLRAANLPVPRGDEQRHRQFEFDHGGERYYAAATVFQMDPGLVWTVGAIAPHRDFLGSVERAQRTSLLVALACVLVAVALATMLARRVSGPILAMVGFMRRVGAGELSETADFGRTPEFRRVSLELNQMIAGLRDGIRMRTSLAVANDVQKRLLPERPPQVVGLDIAGHSTYCDETGGDYFDYLVLPDAPHRLLVVVGDVMGHGVGSALLMAGARGILRSRARGGAGLAEMISHLNDQLFVDTGGQRFMTLYAAIIDVHEGTIHWTSAGHDPAIVYDTCSGTFSELEGGDLPLGIIEGGSYAEFGAKIKSGQIITIGTDGVWEARNPAHEEFGKERLRQAIQASAHGCAAEVEEGINRALAEFRGPQRPHDDTTFVIVRVLPKRASVEEGVPDVEPIASAV
jgi:phosphoserine phosphatase RsbU/P